VLKVGPLFGNAVRDATGLVEASDFPNSQHFNAVSQELNKIVESKVLPDVVKLVKIGRRLEFVGCAEVRSEKQDLRPLKMVPLAVKLIEPQAAP
jgi:predicted lipoprotein